MNNRQKRNILKNKTYDRGEKMSLDDINYGLSQNKRHPWEQVEMIYRTKLRVVDKNLHQIQDFLKPQAQSIFFDRKVEFQNVIDDKKLAEKQNLSNIHNEKEKEFKLKNYDHALEKLKDIMVKYDIKHPLRGEEQVFGYLIQTIQRFEGIEKQKQPFSNKILGIASTNNSYIGYKKDLRQTLEICEVRSDEYKKKEMMEFQKQRTIIKYRLYGKEGINEREFEKLKEWGVVKAKKGTRKVRVKRRVKKCRNTSQGEQQFYTSDDSRSCNSAYTIKQQKVYENNEGNPTEVNMGFEIQPLCPAIYGKKAALIQKQNANSPKTFKQLQSNKQQFHTIEVPSQFRNRRMSKSRNQRDRTPIEMPDLRTHKKNLLNSSFDYIYVTKKSLNASQDSIITKSEHFKSSRKPRKMLMPHLVNKYSIHNSITDLYQIDSAKNTDDSTSFKLGNMQIIHPNQTQQKIQTVTRRLSKTQMDSNMNYLSDVTPRIASQMSNYYAAKSPLKTNIERIVEGGGRLNKQFSLRTPKVTDKEIRTLVQQFPIGLQKEKIQINENEQNDNIFAKISQSEIYKEAFEKKDKFANNQSISAKRKSQSTINKENNQKIKTQLEFLGRNIDKMQTQSQKYYRDLMTKMVLQNFRDEELQKIQEFIKEIDFAEVNQMPGLYELKMKDEKERLKVIKEVIKDHHEGKLDPGKMMKSKKLKK